MLAVAVAVWGSTPKTKPCMLFLQANPAASVHAAVIVDDEEGADGDTDLSSMQQQGQGGAAPGASAGPGPGGARGAPRAAVGCSPLGKGAGGAGLGGLEGGAGEQEMVSHRSGPLPRSHSPSAPGGSPAGAPQVERGHAFECSQGGWGGGGAHV